MKIKVIISIFIFSLLIFIFYIFINKDNIDLKPYLENIKNYNNITYDIKIINNENNSLSSYKISYDKIEHERIINDKKWLHSYILINDHISYENSLYQGNKWIMYQEENNLFNFDYIDILINSIDFDKKIRLSKSEAQEVLNILNGIAGTNDNYNVLDSIEVLVEIIDNQIKSIKLDYSNKISSVDIGVYDKFVIEINFSDINNTLVIIPSDVTNDLEVFK